MFVQVHYHLLFDACLEVAYDFLMQKAEKRGIIKVFYIGREIAIGNKYFEVRIDFVVCLSV